MKSDNDPRSPRPSVNQRILALCALATGSSLMAAAFGFFHVKVFLNIYKIEEEWFQTAQVISLLWNIVNAPLVAYIQDNVNWSVTRTRRETVLYAAPVFAVSFLLFWFPWGEPGQVAPWVTGVHMILALCFWDTMTTYIHLAYACIFTELSLDNSDRLKATRAVTVAHLIGASSIFILQQTSVQLEDFQMFQKVCIIIALVSYLLMRYCGKHGHTARELASVDGDGKETIPDKKQDFPYCQIIRQILFNRDFLSFMVMNFCQEFHRTFLHGFFTIVGDQLIVKGAIPDFTRSVFYGIGPLLSKSAIIFGTPIIGKVGYFKVLRYSYFLKIFLGVIFYLIGPVDISLLMVLMLVDSAAADAATSLHHLPVSDIADSDTLRYNRRNPVTSMVYGTNALFGKSSHSLSPMFVVFILNTYGYEALKENRLGPSGITELNGAMYTLLCLFPLVIGTIQTVAWSFYSIRHKRNVDITMVIPADGEKQ